MARSHRARLRWFLGVATVVLVLAIWGTVGLPWRARIFPQTVAALGLTLSVLALVTSLLAPSGVAEEPPHPDDVDTERHPRPIRQYLAWAVSYLAAIALVGFPAASALWVSLFLRREDHMPWRFAIAAGAAVVILLVALTRIARMPSGWLLG